MAKNELSTLNFYVSVLLEGLAVAFLVFIGGLGFIKGNFKEQKNISETAAIYALALATLTHCLKDVSGSHINPAITLSCMFTRRVSVLRAILYILFQCGGGILGALALREFTPINERQYLSMTSLAKGISLQKGIGYEMIFTFLLTWTHFAAKNTRDQFKGYGGPLAVGIVYGLSHIIILPYTGCSLNPARSLGPAVIMKEFQDHWIYWAGTILPACLAGLLHDLVFINAKYTPQRDILVNHICSPCCSKPSREVFIVENHHERNAYFVKKPDESGV